MDIVDIPSRNEIYPNPPTLAEEMISTGAALKGINIKQYGGQQRNMAGIQLVFTKNYRSPLFDVMDTPDESIA